MPPPSLQKARVSAEGSNNFPIMIINVFDNLAFVAAKEQRSLFKITLSGRHDELALLIEF